MNVNELQRQTPVIASYSKPCGCGDEHQCPRQQQQPHCHDFQGVIEVQRRPATGILLLLLPRKQTSACSAYLCSPSSQDPWPWSSRAAVPARSVGRAPLASDDWPPMMLSDASSRLLRLGMRRGGRPGRQRPQPRGPRASLRRLPFSWGWRASGRRRAPCGPGRNQ